MIAKERQRLARAQTERTLAFTSGNFRPRNQYLGISGF